MQTSLNNFGKGLLHAVIVFLALYGTVLVGLVPNNVTTISIGSVLAGLIAWAQHAYATPAGSTVVTHAEG